jgi:SAM-dependent methyltransferase
MELNQRLNGVAQIIERSNAELKHVGKSLLTGFVPAAPELLVKAALELRKHKESGTSLDLGCGNGGWLLMAAAAGYPSYGIDLNPILLKECKRNYDEAVARGFIDPQTPCLFVRGDMIPRKHREEYEEFTRANAHPAHSQPINRTIAGYEGLPVDMSTADIIYTWAWPVQSRVLYPILQREAKQDAVFVLHSYRRYMRETREAGLLLRNRLILSELGSVSFGANQVFIGRRAARMAAVGDWT